MAQQHLGPVPRLQCNLPVFTAHLLGVAAHLGEAGGRGVGRGHHTVPDISKHTPSAQTQELVGT